MADVWAWFDMAAYARGGGSYYDHCRYESCISNMFLGLLLVIAIGVVCTLVAAGFGAIRNIVMSVEWKPIIHIGGVVVGSVGLILSMFAGLEVFILTVVVLLTVVIGYIRRDK
jgi:hypothetical protein